MPNVRKINEMEFVNGPHAPDSTSKQGERGSDGDIYVAISDAAPPRSSVLPRPEIALNGQVDDRLSPTSAAPSSLFSQLGEGFGMNSYPRYPAYKDSGIEWLGEIPLNWGSSALKRLVSTPISDGPHETPDFIDEGVPFLSAEAVKDGKLDFNRKRGYIAGDVHTIYSQKCQPIRDDIFMVKSGNTTGNIAIVETDDIFSIWSPLALIRCNQTKILPRYTYFFMNSPFFQRNVALASSYGTQPNIGMGVVENLSMVYPLSISEQRAIAAFLDRETARIDTLIAKQEMLIALLHEKRRALISHAVTKGLNRDAPMKGSGVAWLGEVPAHWTVAPFKRMARKITDGAHVSPETENGVYAFVSTKDVRDGCIDFENCLRTSEESYKYLLRMGCKPVVGDVLFSKDGTVGRTVVISEDREFVVASSLIIISPIPNILLPEFLNYLCQSTLVVSQVEGFVKGAGLPRLSIQNLLKIVGVFPPITEQKAIVSFIDSELSALSRLIAKAQQFIELSREHRTALIAAAVTGKIDVRGIDEGILDSDGVTIVT